MRYPIGILLQICWRNCSDHPDRQFSILPMERWMGGGGGRPGERWEELSPISSKTQLFGPGSVGLWKGDLWEYSHLHRHFRRRPQGLAHAMAWTKPSGIPDRLVLGVRLVRRVSWIARLQATSVSKAQVKA
eukprot:gene11865-biopygen366